MELDCLSSDVSPVYGDEIRILFYTNNGCDILSVMFGCNHPVVPAGLSDIKQRDGKGGVRNEWT